MTFSISDTFDNVLGFSNYDTDPDSQPIPPAILTNRHRDIRLFDKRPLFRPRTMADLDTKTMTDLDGQTMLQMEEILLVAGETWSATGNGGVISTDLDATGDYAGVGEWAAYDLWHALKFDCNGVALSKTLLSDWPDGSAGAEVDISQMNTLSLVIDDTGITGGITAVTLKLNSDALGTFGLGSDSANIVMSKTGLEWKASISGITGNCNQTAVTGVSIKVQGAPMNGESLYVFALRAYMSGYDPSVGIDINTRRNAAVYPVTLDLADATAPIMIRGTSTNDAGDPRTQDATGRLVIKKGLMTTTAPTYNTFGLVFREDRDADHFVIVYLDVASDNIQWRIDYHDGGSVTSSFGPFAVGPTARTALLAKDYFVWQVDTREEGVTTSLYQSDGNEVVGRLEYSDSETATGVSTTRGRQGWFASIVDRDIQIQQFYGFGLTFSTFLTKPQISFTPVDGCQLTASYSIDDNLFTGFTGIGAIDIDTNRALSIDGSYLTTGPIASNGFLIFNFEQAYLDFDIWMPNQVALENQPRLVLRSPSSLTDITFPPLDLQGNQWNHIYIDLAETQAVGGLSYQIFLERSEGRGTTYDWNVDNFVIAVRNVAWKARTAEANPWVEFRDTVNDSGGAIHFTRDQRGKALQVTALALTENAWLGPFSLKPHYAELGQLPH